MLENYLTTSSLWNLLSLISLRILGVNYTLGCKFKHYNWSFFHHIILPHLQILVANPYKCEVGAYVLICPSLSGFDKPLSPRKSCLNNFSKFYVSKVLAGVSVQGRSKLSPLVKAVFYLIAKSLDSLRSCGILRSLSGFGGLRKSTSSPTPHLAIRITMTDLIKWFCVCESYFLWCNNKEVIQGIDFTSTRGITRTIG